MGDNAILAIGGYLPALRFERAAAGKALRWSGLGGGGKGRRSVAAHDEDALTMAVEASRNLGEVIPDSIVFASTSAPFTERAHATLLCEALNLSPRTRSLDVAGCRRSALSALLDRLSHDGRSSIVASGERRAVRAGSTQELNWGDGAAAALVGPGTGLARLVGQASISRDLVDVYASPGRPAPYAAEERWVRDIAVADILRPTLADALASAGIAAADVKLAAVPEPVSGTYKALAAESGLKAANVCAEIQAAAGDLGAAMPLFGLALALERAAPGEVILVIAFGSGCDVALFRAGDGVANLKPSAGPALAQGYAFDDYVRLLSLEGAIDLDWGPRSEADPKVPASVLWRGARAMHGFVGGRCRETGTVQFPKSRISVAPGSTAIDTQDDIRLADVPARIVSITADRLNFTPDPPFHFGLVQFENGARVMMEMVDTGRSTPAVGDPVRMRFRIKAADRKRGFKTYFWKAAPVARPALEG